MRLRKGFLFGILFSLLVCSFFVSVGHSSLSDGLVGCWNMDEGTSSLVSDSSGNGNDGLLTGGQWVNAVTDKGIYFDNAQWSPTNYVTVDDDPTLNPTDEVSLCCWFNVTGVLDNWQFICGKQTQFELAVYSGQFAIRMNFVSAGDEYHFFGSLFADDLYYFVMVYDGGTMKGYLNGTLAVSYARVDTISVTAYDFLIGQVENAGVNGTLDDVRLYNRALSSGEVFDLFKLGVSFDTFSSSPVVASSVEGVPLFYGMLLVALFFVGADLWLIYKGRAWLVNFVFGMVSLSVGAYAMNYSVFPYLPYLGFGLLVMSVLCMLSAGLSFKRKR